MFARPIFARVRLMTISLLSFYLVAGMAPSAAADGTAIDIINDQAGDAKLFTFDYGVPTSPALSLAGLSPDKLNTSTSLKPFVLSLPGLFNSSSGQTSAALDGSIAWLLDSPDHAPLSNYQDDISMRLEYRTRLGVAIDRGDAGGTDPSKAKASIIAIGFSTSLLDSSDPVMATLDPVKRAVQDSSGTWNSVWDTCLGKPGDDLKPFIGDQDHKRTTIGNRESQITRIISKAGGANGHATGDVVPGLSSGDQSKILAAEADLKQIAGFTDVPASDDPNYMVFTFGRLTADYNAAEAYIGTASKEQIAHDAKALAFIEDCQKAGSAAAQHNAALDVGFGLVLNGTPGKFEGFGNPKAAIWVAGRYPLDLGTRNPTDCTDKDGRSLGASLFSCWMFGGSGRFSSSELVQTGVAATPQFEAEVIEGWVGLERVDPNSKLGAYFGYLDQNAIHLADKSLSQSGTRWLISGAFNLSSVVDGLWVVGSYGAADGSVTKLNANVAMLTLTFGPPTIGSSFIQK